MIAVTGATGQLGRLVIEALLKRFSPSEIVAAVRNPEKAEDLAAKSDVGAAKGGLFDDSRQISALTGHPTATLEQSMAAAFGR